MEDLERGRRKSTGHSPGSEEMTGWDQRLGAREGLSVGLTPAASRPTCGLVLGEVTLLGEEGIGQY